MNGLNDARVKSVIKKVISGRLTTGQAAAKLGISKQYVNRLKRAYAEKGASAFGHGNKGKARRWRTEAETEERIAWLYKAKYEGFNFKHFLEKLNEEEGISITYKPLHRILTAAGFRSTKGRKSRKEKAKPSKHK